MGFCENDKYISSDKHPLVSIIIVTIGSKDYLWHCLDSVKMQSYTNIETIVIDNSCCLNFSTKIAQSFNFAKFFPSVTNLYYSSSLNKGIALSKGEFTLCLNDDVILDKDFVKKAVNGFFLNKKIGLISGKILRSDGKTIDTTGLFLTCFRTAKERGYGSRDVGQFEKMGFIFGVNGAVAFYRKKMLEDIRDGYGYFDTRLRMFYEDVDVSWRANKKGWFGYYIPAAKAYHVRGGSLRPDCGIDKPFARGYLNDQLHYELVKNRYLVILKNETIFGFIFYLIPILIYDAITLAYILLFKPKMINFILKKIIGGTKHVIVDKLKLQVFINRTIQK